jgi:hypothetical protein
VGGCAGPWCGCLNGGGGRSSLVSQAFQKGIQGYLLTKLNGFGVRIRFKYCTKESIFVDATTFDPKYFKSLFENLCR